MSNIKPKQRNITGCMLLKRITCNIMIVIMLFSQIYYIPTKYKKNVNEKFSNLIDIEILNPSNIPIGILIEPHTSSTVQSSPCISYENESIAIVEKNTIDKGKESETILENSSSDMEESTEEEEVISPIAHESEVTYDIGYVNCRLLNVRKVPSIDSEIIAQLSFDTEVQYSVYNDEWSYLKYNDDIAYIATKYISDKNHDYQSIEVVGDSRKSYMDFRAITSKTSLQYKLQKYAFTDTNGVRTVEGRYCIALGSYYTHSVGQYVDLILENGTTIHCIIGDCKKDIDTNYNHSVGNDGGVAEFVVDTPALSYAVKKTGDVSYSSEEWMSNVSEIKIYEQNIFNE